MSGLAIRTVMTKRAVDGSVFALCTGVGFASSPALFDAAAQPIATRCSGMVSVNRERLLRGLLRRLIASGGLLSLTGFRAFRYR